MNSNTLVEAWKDIKGYEGLYEVSNLGSVKSLERKVPFRGGFTTVRERELKQQTNADGYLSVTLSRDNKRKTIKVHRLVAEAFVDNPENLTEVNHKDENKTNNKINNLEWCTILYNNEYGTRKEKIYSHPNYVKAMKDLGKARRKKVMSTCLKTGETKEYESLLSVEEDGFDNSHVSAVCRGKRKTHKGFVWKFK